VSAVVLDKNVGKTMYISFTRPMLKDKPASCCLDARSCWDILATDTYKVLPLHEFGNVLPSDHYTKNGKHQKEIRLVDQR
jgi:hypothetical protein